MEHADERWCVEDTVVAKEGVVSGDAVEGGTSKVDGRGEMEKDFLEDLVLTQRNGDSNSSVRWEVGGSAI